MLILYINVTEKKYIYQKKNSNQGLKACFSWKSIVNMNRG